MTKLYSWNVNGLRACMEKGFREFLEREQPDVLCLQETKMQPHQADFDFPGYEVYWNSAVKKGYSGTAVLTKEKPLSVSYDLGFEDKHNTEGRAITVEYPEYYLVCVYVPNAQDGLKRIDYRMEWEDDFRAYVGGLKKKKPVIANKIAGYSGKALFPVALGMVYKVYEAVKIPIIGMGGVSTAEDVLEMMLAGATAVGVGAANLLDPYASKKIVEELPGAMEKYGIENLGEIIGGAHG